MLKKQLNIGALNVRGLIGADHEEKLMEDATSYNVDIIALSETHIKREVSQQKLKYTNKIDSLTTNFVLYSCNTENNSYHGVGMLIKEGIQHKFKRITERVCTVDVRLKHNTLKLIAIYAPTLSSSEENPQIREDLYNAIESIVKNVSDRDIVIIAGDFNAKTGSAWKDYPQNMGRFGKGHVNSSGNHLLNLCFQNDLIITNTLFKHRLSHICTWEAPFRKFKMKDGTERRQPIRNQIDYIITNRKYQPFIINSRSYNNLKTETEHRLVKMTIKLDWYKIKFDTKNEPKYNLGDFNKPNTIKVYKNNIQKKCDNLFSDNMSSQDRWNNICETCKDAGAKVLQKKKRNQKHQDETLKNLSNRNQKLKTEINGSKKEETRILKKEEI